MQRVAHVPAHHLDEGRVALGCPDRRHMADDPEDEPCDPETQPKPDCSRERAIEDGDRARRAGQEDWLGERTVHRRLETRNDLVPCDLRHHTSAPPPKEKNDRKNDDAANAIDSPNTIWMRRRKPPAVSPKASVRPVTMMMMTAMILETGPSIDWRICWSGCSQGMFEPAAIAGVVRTRVVRKTVNANPRANRRFMCGPPRMWARPLAPARSPRRGPIPRRGRVRSVGVRNHDPQARR